MKIEKIKKINGSKYQICLDNGEKIIVYDEAIIKNNILYKKELTEKEIKSLTEVNSYYSCYNASIKYLSKGIHSEKEYMKFLSKYEISDKEKDKLVLELKNIKLLDDSKFASAFVYDKFNLSNYGPLKIRKELLEHNIDENLINIELSKISRSEILTKVEKLINKKMKMLKGSSYIIKQKIHLYMNNLGYSKEDVDLYMMEDVDDIKALENDFEKIYMKLARKNLEQESLFLKIKQKLYQKGYSLSKIDEIIEKKRR